MTVSNNRLAGPGYIILNVIRVANIVSLLAVTTASMVMLVKNITVSNFFFFDACTHVITTFTSLFLILSELSLFKGYFARNWPLLSPAHGFVSLGLVMIVLGINILGNLNKPAYSQKSLGLAFWRIVIGGGIVVLVFGVFNVIASYIFRDRSQGITARQVRAKGAVAVTSSQRGDTSPMIQTSAPILGSPVKSPFNFTFNKRDSSLPAYQSKSPVKSRMSLFPWKRNQAVADEESGRRPVMQISSPMNPNPQFAEYVRQPAPTHPSDRRTSSAYSTPRI